MRIGYDPFLPGVLSRLPEPPQKVALLRASRIGDFICATPAFRALRMALPNAEITLIGQPFVEELVVRSPHLDHFVPFPGFPGIAEQFFDARQTVQFFQQMQAEQFDLAVQMHGSGVYSNPFTLMLGARTTTGFVREGDPAGRLDAALPMPQRELQQQYGGTAVVIGGTDEWQLAERVAQGIGGASLNLAGRTSLTVLGAVVEQLAVLVTNDSGPAHVAYPLSTPTVTVFGGTNPAVWGPLEADQHAVLAHEVSCRPCDYGECPVGYTCLEGVTVKQVVEVAETVMGESHSR